MDREREAWWQSWSVEFESGVPVYRQIVNRVAAALAAGQLQPGDQLPTIRRLHQHLGVNPNTVAKAYRELELKGFISGEPGNGSYVRPDASPPPPPTSRQRQTHFDRLYQRLLADAAECGLTEKEIIRYIHERETHERPK